MHTHQHTTEQYAVARPASLFEQMELASNELATQVARIVRAAATDTLRETLPTGELQSILDVLGCAAKALKKVRFQGELKAITGWVRFDGAVLVYCEQGADGALPVYEAIQ